MPSDKRIPSEETDRVFREAAAHMERLARIAVDRLPELVEESRGGLPAHRFPENGVDEMFALKLVQLVGNMKAGEVLIEGGCFHEWDMVKRLVYETLEDVKFVALGEREGARTKLHSRYMACFFSEDFDEEGGVLQAGVGAVSRREITKYIEGASSVGNEEALSEVVRNIHRLHSASVHGRAAGITRGCYDAGKRAFWTGGPRNEVSMMVERFALRLAMCHTASCVGRWIVDRWWGSEYARRTVKAAERLRRAVEEDGRTMGIL